MISNGYLVVFQRLVYIVHTVNITVPFAVQKWVQCNPMVLFRLDVKKIKGAAHKNSDVDGVCKRVLTYVQYPDTEISKKFQWLAVRFPHQD